MNVPSEQNGNMYWLKSDTSPPKIHVYPESQNATFFENKVFASVIS